MLDNEGYCVYCKKLDNIAEVKLEYTNDMVDETTAYYFHLCDKCRIREVDKVWLDELKTLVALLRMKPDRLVEALSAWNKDNTKEYAIVYAPNRRKVIK